ncbi:hypothetical protein D3C72_1223290 [compost metagenome]
MRPSLGAHGRAVEPPDRLAVGCDVGAAPLFLLAPERVDPAQLDPGLARGHVAPDGLRPDGPGRDAHRLAVVAVGQVHTHAGSTQGVGGSGQIEPETVARAGRVTLARVVALGLSARGRLSLQRVSGGLDVPGHRGGLQPEPLADRVLPGVDDRPVFFLGQLAPDRPQQVGQLERRGIGAQVVQVGAKVEGLGAGPDRLLPARQAGARGIQHQAHGIRARAQQVVVEAVLPAAGLFRKISDPDLHPEGVANVLGERVLSVGDPASLRLGPSIRIEGDHHHCAALTQCRPRQGIPLRQRSGVLLELVRAVGLILSAPAARASLPVPHAGHTDGGEAVPGRDPSLDLALRDDEAPRVERSGDRPRGYSQMVGAPLGRLVLRRVAVPV